MNRWVMAVVCVAGAFLSAAAWAQAPGPAAGGAAERVAAEPGRGMSHTQAAILGIVEGVTEYLPVSSTGHLILAERLMGLGHDPASKDASDAFAICIQAGAIAAVLGLYLRRVRQMALGVLGRDEAGKRLAVNIVVAFVPALVIGALGSRLIKQHLFGLWPVVAAWLVGGLAILGVSWWRSRRKHLAPREGLGLSQLTWKMALVIGLLQCVAMWPGTSRSLMTIVGGVIVGLSLPAAVEFSFLLGVLTLTAATVHDAKEHGMKMVEAFGFMPLVIGFFFATISAAAAVQWMVGYLQRHGLWIFGWYRVALALVVALLLWRGVIAP